METVTIAKEEYLQLKENAAKVLIIEEVLHQPELSTQIKANLIEARKIPVAQLMSTAEIKRKFKVV